MYALNMTSSEHFGSDSQKSWSYFYAYNINNKAKYTFFGLVYSLLGITLLR